MDDNRPNDEDYKWAIQGGKMEETKACQATPAKDLEDKIMNSNIPKSESEWWARRRIAALEAAVREKDKEICNMQASYEDSIGEHVLEENDLRKQIATLTAKQDEMKGQIERREDRLLKAWAEITTLTEELRLSGLRGDSLDRVISESTDEYVALQEENKRLLEALNDLGT